MTAYYDMPPKNIRHLYVEVDGAWHYKDEAPDDEQQAKAVREFDLAHGQALKKAILPTPPQEDVGDVNSDERGSGARYNTGKPPMAYIPLRQQIIVWRGYTNFTAGMRRIMDELARFEQGEVPMWNVVSLLSKGDLVDSTWVWQYGAAKYAAFNWAKGMAWSIPLACISRHVQEMCRGRENDIESGCTHWGHVVCNILMLEHFEHFYQEGDDRPPSKVFK